MTDKTTRRRFLKHSTEAVTLTAVVSTLGPVHAQAAANPEQVNLGIIGCGGIMGLHVTGLVSRRERVSLRWLCDVDPRQMDKISAHIGFPSALPKRTAPEAFRFLISAAGPSWEPQLSWRRQPSCRVSCGQRPAKTAERASIFRKPATTF